uniref:DUF3037 domain-containing protein n=1 Tax=Caenorhabditis tropicalis TaxID=1561998 RepID=A0A1I7TZF9_9PELO
MTSKMSTSIFCTPEYGIVEEKNYHFAGLIVLHVLPENADSSIKKLREAVLCVEVFIPNSRVEAVRRTAFEQSNIVKVALHLTEPEMKTIAGQDRLAKRLYDLIRMDGQYVTRKETLDSVIQLMEIHSLFNSQVRAKKVRFS